MGEVVNLRRARKSRARSEEAARADANRLVHGRSRTERQATADEAARLRRQLDGAERER